MNRIAEMPIWLTLALFVLAPREAAAFKMKSHLKVANEAMAGIVKRNGEWVVQIKKYGDIPIRNDLIVEAVRAHPRAFRAGAIGPDGYPDLVGGQLWVHVNNGAIDCCDPSCPNPPACGGICPTDAKRCVDSGVPLEERSLDQWRSIDYGMVLLREAVAYRQGEASSSAYDERLKAIAFAYGYLCHMMADGFAHGWVNQWARQPFSYSEGGGIFGPITEELQHLSVEGYLDAHIDVADLALETPVEFLNSVYLSPMAWGIGNQQHTAPAGAFAGPYYAELIKIRDKLRVLGDWNNWIYGIEGPAGAFVQVPWELHQLLTAPHNGIGDPIRDIEDFFWRRYLVVEGLLHRWVELSGCVAQNLANGAARSYGQIVATDACADIDFERGFDNALREIFRGELNEAAHAPDRRLDQYGNPLQHPIIHPGHDFGGMAANLKKISNVVLLIADKVLLIDPIEDIRTFREIRDAILNCKALEIGPRICEDACEQIIEWCENLHCLGCPKSGNRHSCWGSGSFWTKLGRAAVCGALPHCVDCAGDVTRVLCSSVDSVVMPGVCDLCNGNPVCKTLDSIDEMNARLHELMLNLGSEIIDPLVEEIKRRLIEVYVGPYVDEFLGVYSDMQKAKHSGKPGWFVNIAFLKEDLTNDPDYLPLLVKQVTGIAVDVLDNTASAADAAAHIVGQTAYNANLILSTIVDGVSYDGIWYAVVHALYRIIKDRNLSVLEELQGNLYAFLDDLSFREDRTVYKTRLGKFAALMAKMGMFYRLKGPTARAAARHMWLSGGIVEDETERIDVYRFYPFHNAIELSKLGFLSGAALNSLTAGFDQGNRQVSAICSQIPHIACDVVQSLDDPNHVNHEMREGTSISVNGALIDPERSVEIWESRNMVWHADGTVNPGGMCRLGRTDFPLATSNERIYGLYARIFRGPEDCLVPFSDTYAAVLTAIIGNLL